MFSSENTTAHQTMQISFLCTNCNSSTCRSWDTFTIISHYVSHQ